jgi:hypothetical protein
MAAVVFGILMFAEFGPLYKIRITLDDAAYHEVDSSENGISGSRSRRGTKHH